MWTDLRAFLDALRKKGELVDVTESTDPYCGVTAGLQKTCKVGGPALLFRNVRGSDIPVLGGLYATPERVALALGCDSGAATQAAKALERASEKGVPPVRVDSGPCQEICWLGDQADLGRLPIITHAPDDGGGYIASAVAFGHHPVHGRNLSIHRCMVRGPRSLSIAFNSQSHLLSYFLDAEREGRPLDVAQVIGAEPLVPIVSQIMPDNGIDGDEADVAGALRGAPLPMVRCRTIDVDVPAAAEIVIEGRMLPGVRQMEGPFAESSGYYGQGKNSPLIEVTAITMRSEPIYHVIHCGKPPSEIHFMCQIPTEVSFHRYIRRLFPSVVAVHFTPGGIVQHHVVVAIRKNYNQEPINIGLAAFGTNIGIKQVVVVDDDIDITDPVDVEWAIATRVQADEDLLVIPRLAGGPVDPSSRQDSVVSGVVIDATRPWGRPYPQVVTVPGAEQFRIPGVK